MMKNSQITPALALSEAVTPAQCAKFQLVHGKMEILYGFCSKFQVELNIFLFIYIFCRIT